MQGSTSDLCSYAVLTLIAWPAAGRFSAPGYAGRKCLATGVLDCLLCRAAISHLVVHYLIAHSELTRVLVRAPCLKARDDLVAAVAAARRASSAVWTILFIVVCTVLATHDAAHADALLLGEAQLARLVLGVGVCCAGIVCGGCIAITGIRCGLAVSCAGLCLNWRTGEKQERQTRERVPGLKGLRKGGCYSYHD